MCAQHQPDTCPFKDKECFFCKNKGHTAKKCRKKLKIDQRKDGRKIYQLDHNTVDQPTHSTGNNQQTDNECPFYHLYRVGLVREKPIIIDLEIKW